jgi:hypothetical protein
MQEQMNKTKLIGNIQQERQRLERTLVDINADLMVTPGVIEDWTVKDILAHITVWEQRMVSWLGDTLRGQIPQMLPPGMTWDDLDVWNEQTYQKHRHHPLGEVLADFAMSYPQALKAVQDVPEEDLIDPDRFEWREGQPLWVMVAANTFWHYKEHNESISVWLEGIKGS